MNLTLPVILRLGEESSLMPAITLLDPSLRSG
jgi:hypothetical protein